MLEVWGDPIAHSLSPTLHTAAYAELGLPWRYGRRRVAEADFDSALAAAGGDVRGLSLTYPLKNVAYRAARTRDRHADLTGAVNTLLLTEGGPYGFNTDVGGLVRDLRERGVDDVGRARIVGAGATATSALVALVELGADRLDVVARRPEAALPLVALGEHLGVHVDVASLDAEGAVPPRGFVPVTVSALPGGAEVSPEAAARLAEGGGLLYDVVYGHWPTVLAAAWQKAGGVACDGLGMLLQQAVGQVRVFSTGDAVTPLRHEAALADVMRLALMGD